MAVLIEWFVDAGAALGKAIPVMYDTFSSSIGFVF